MALSTVKTKKAKVGMTLKASDTLEPNTLVTEITDADGVFIAATNSEAAAADIVKAVNSYDGLVMQVRNLMSSLRWDETGDPEQEAYDAASLFLFSIHEKP